MVEQTSASDRIEAARKALAGYDRAKEVGFAPNALVLADALRALITPPAVGESDEGIAKAATEELWKVWDHTDFAEVQGIILGAVRSAIQTAHETWEPEVAQRPSQEQMLRWVGLDFTEDADVIIVHRKVIAKEIL